MIYFLTALNVVILGAVAYLFYTFRKALDASGMRQMDDYLHELEGSVAQLTEQFERTSTKISKDLLQKTTQLQALIGECDTKLVQMDRLRTGPQPVTAAEVLAGRVVRSAPTPQPNPAAESVRPEPGGVPTISPAVAARRMSASEALAKAQASSPASTPLSGTPAQQAEAAAVEASMQPSAVALSSSLPQPIAETAEVAPEAERQPLAAAVGQPKEKYRLIVLPSSDRMDSSSIAMLTNLIRGEVEMLLVLRRQGKI